MLAEVEETLSAHNGYSELERNVLILLREIVSRLLRTPIEGLHLDLEIKHDGTVRFDIWHETVKEQCELLSLLDDGALQDLARVWKDRRRPCGVWLQLGTSAA